MYIQDKTNFRLATPEDLPAMLAIVKQAQESLRLINVDQWQNGYPSPSVVEQDITNRAAYVLECEEGLLAMATVIFNREPTYDTIYDGNWLTNGNFVVVHRLAVNTQVKRKGIASVMFREVEELSKQHRIPSFKVDTHEDNFPMRRTLEKNGFTHCGRIILGDGSPRVAYEKTLKREKMVCIYCASSRQIDRQYFDAAEKLGTLLGRQGISIINGAGSAGLMKTVSEAAMTAGGKAIGVIPRFMVGNGWCHAGMTRLIEVETMHERKQLMATMSDAVVALPGGCGTLEELLEIITWKQLGLYNNPIIILNTKHYFDPLLEMLRRAVDEQFMEIRHASLWHIVEKPEDAVRRLTESDPQK